MRLVYFRGHPKCEKSVLVTLLCRDYETISSITRGELEFCSRTLANLYNLQTVRGPLVQTASGVEVQLDACMVGPTVYYGHIDPRGCYRLRAAEDGGFSFVAHPGPPARDGNPPTRVVGEDDVVRVTEYRWIRGRDISDADRRMYSLRYEDEETSMVSSDGQLHRRAARRSADSLFANPGVLTLPEDNLQIPVLEDAHLYDLASFRAQVVRNDDPFAFRGDALRPYPHALHTLRCISYQYGPFYREKYLMSGNGLFIEKHDFIQSITPQDPRCGGAIILGREVPSRCGSNLPDLELLAVRVPFGFTILVEPQAIHGDSTMTGNFLMAMTGNHLAMGTADTVFLKVQNSARNVRVHLVGVDGGEPADGFLSLADLPVRNRALLTSDRMTPSELVERDADLKAEIANRVGQSTNSRSLGRLKRTAWRPVVYAPASWEKTIGTKLPFL